MKKNFPITTILFDMDGTLIDSTDVWVDVGTYCLSELSIDVPREQMVKGIVKFETLKSIGVKDLLGFGKRLNEVFCERITEIKLNKNAEKLIRTVQNRNIRIALVTTAGNAAVTGILKNLNIQKYFETVVTYEDVTHHKPSPEAPLKAMKMLDADPASTMIVGDTRNDILAGKAAGIRTVLYYPAKHMEVYDKDHLLGLNADYYIKDLLEVAEIIQ